MRVHIGIYGSDYNYTVKNISEKEFELLKDIAYETDTRSAGLKVEQIPETQELFSRFEYFMEHPKYEDWKTTEIIADFVKTEYIDKSWSVMEFLTNELLNRFA